MDIDHVNDAISHWPGQGNVIKSEVVSLNAMVQVDAELQNYISFDHNTGG